jgi:hypothetical protein
VVDDVAASYPVTIDPYVAPAPGPAVIFDRNSSAQLGWSVALSAYGRTALVGAPVSGTGGAPYVYTEPAGGWFGTPLPAATFTGTSSEELGWSVALSDGATTAVVGARWTVRKPAPPMFTSSRPGAGPGRHRRPPR